MPRYSVTFYETNALTATVEADDKQDALTKAQELMSICHTEDSTNIMIDRVLERIDSLIAWAETDEQHARENDDKNTAADDRRRQANLRKARALIEESKR